MKMDEQNIEIIKGIMCRGIYSTVEMSEILELEHGVKIAPHIISEYLYRSRRESTE